MKFILATVLLSLLPTYSFAQENLRFEAHCEIFRIDTQSEAISSDKVEEKLSFATTATGGTRAYTYLESTLIPSYMIEFVVVANNGIERMNVRTLRKYDGYIMSSFRSTGLVTNTRFITADSRYTAEAKNIFLSGDRYIFDITCWQNVMRD